MDEDSFDENLDAAMGIERRISIEREKEALGFEYWEYAWVRPEELDAHGADRWRVTYTPLVLDGKVLMERKRLADDDILRDFAA